MQQDMENNCKIIIAWLQQFLNINIRPGQNINHTDFLYDNK